jgi:hypothetical protein
VPLSGFSGCTTNGDACAVGSLRGIEGLTCDNSAGPSITVGLDISSQAGRYRDINIRGPVTNGMRLAKSGDTTGVVVENVTGCVDTSGALCPGTVGTVGTLVDLASGNLVDVAIRGLNLIGSRPTGHYILKDDARTGSSYCDQSVAEYDESPASGGGPGVRYTTASKTGSGC